MLLRFDNTTTKGSYCGCYYLNFSCIASVIDFGTVVEETNYNVWLKDIFPRMCENQSIFGATA